MAVATVRKTNFRFHQGFQELTEFLEEDARRKVARYFIIDEDDVLSKNGNSSFKPEGFWVGIRRPNGDEMKPDVIEASYILHLRFWKNNGDGAKPWPGLGEFRVLTEKEVKKNGAPQQTGDRNVFYLGTAKVKRTTYKAYFLLHHGNRQRRQDHN